MMLQIINLHGIFIIIRINLEIINQEKELNMKVIMMEKQKA